MLVIVKNLIIVLLLVDRSLKKKQCPHYCDRPVGNINVKVQVWKGTLITINDVAGLLLPKPATIIHYRNFISVNDSSDYKKS